MHLEPLSWNDIFELASAIGTFITAYIALYLNRRQPPMKIRVDRSSVNGQGVFIYFLDEKLNTSGFIKLNRIYMTLHGEELAHSVNLDLFREGLTRWRPISNDYIVTISIKRSSDDEQLNRIIAEAFSIAKHEHDDVSHNDISKKDFQLGFEFIVNDPRVHLNPVEFNLKKLEESSVIDMNKIKEFMH